MSRLSEQAVTHIESGAETQIKIHLAGEYLTTRHTHDHEDLTYGNHSQ
jgi:hypothetical protein